MSRRSRGYGLTVQDLVTTPDYPGREIEKPLGIVTSVVVETHLSHSEELMSAAVSKCYRQILRQAGELDADAVVAVHFDYKQVCSHPEYGFDSSMADFVMAYGTAVRLK